MRPLSLLAAAGLLAASATSTFAAPMSQPAVMDGGVLLRAQGPCHADCRRHGDRWIRFNRYCEPRPCREFRDDDDDFRRHRRDRDDSCVKIGPVWYCGN